MIAILADLHIHTVLSPCASRQMLPRNIVRTCLDRGLSMIAICDHNSAANVSAVAKAAEQEGGGALKVIPGIEVTTREEVHVLGLFPALEGALAVGEHILVTLPGEKFAAKRSHPVPGNPDRLQWVVDAEDSRTGTEQRLLAAASGYCLEDAVNLIHRHGGITVAAHVDRRAFSVLGQLGFFPETPRFFAAEISAAGAARVREEDRWVEKYREYNLPLISSSDSHCPEEIASSCTAFKIVEPCFAELILAVQGIGSRRCRIA
jgi:predicted metal-dependent phosphoesterase TrpH